MRWFVSAYTSAAFNELDRHVLNGYASETAFTCEPDDDKQLATRVSGDQLAAVRQLQMVASLASRSLTV